MDIIDINFQSMVNEYNDFFMVNEIIRMITSFIPDKKYEARIIIEKWILSIASENTHHRWCQHLDKLFGIDFYNKQLLWRLSKYINRRKSREIITHIIRYVKNPINIGQQIPSYVKIEDNYLTYGDFKLTLNPKMNMLITRFGINNFLKMVLYYHSLCHASQQWSISSNKYHEMKKYWNINNEAFASPINFDMYHIPGSSFCSLNLETDQPFGSLGRFENVRLEDYGNWVINPPFIEDILKKAINLSLDHIDNSHKNMNLMFVIPYWTHLPFISQIQNSKYFKESEILYQNDFEYVDYLNNEQFKGSRGVVYIGILSKSHKMI